MADAGALIFSEARVVKFEFGVKSQESVVKKLKQVPNSNILTLKVPHMGWNELNIKNNNPILSGIPDKSYFYFVHSYYVVPEDESIITTTTDYGIKFASMVSKDNVFAVQFHPEKSQALGLRILKNFGDIVSMSS